MMDRKRVFLIMGFVSVFISIFTLAAAFIAVPADVYAQANFFQPQITVPPSCPLKTEGDADCNNLTDRGDLSVWQCEYLGGGKCPLSEPYKASFNLDPRTDLVDYEIWRRYSKTIPTGIIPSGYATPAVDPTSTPGPSPDWTPDIIDFMTDEINRIILMKMIDVLKIHFITYGNYPIQGNPDDPLKWLFPLTDKRILSEQYAYFLKTIYKQEECFSVYQSGLCYRSDGEKAILFIRLKQSANISKCVSGAANFLWSSEDYQLGTVCLTMEDMSGPRLSGYNYLLQ